MAKEAVSEHSDEELPDAGSPGRDEPTELDEEPSRERWSEPPAGVDSPGVEAAELGTPNATPKGGESTASDPIPPARPRFRTLMGVPRNDPHLDLYAGNPMLSAVLLDALAEDASPIAAAESSGSALETELGEPPEELLEEVDATEITDEVQTPAGPLFSPLRTDTTPLPRIRESEALSHLFLDANTSLDVSAEVAALRSSRTSGPRWLVALALVLSGVAIFSVAAPREWERATRWLGRTRLSGASILVRSWQQSAQALLPNARVSAPGLVPDRFEATTTVLHGTPGAAAEMATAEPATSSLGAAAPINRSIPASPATTSSAPTSSSTTGPDTTTPTTGPAPGTAVGTRPLISNANLSLQVAAARKRTVRPATKDIRRVKGLAVQQNPPLKNVRSGIIRATPF